MMKKIGFSLLLIVFSVAATFAQKTPVKWTAKTTFLSNTTYQVAFTANIDDDWFIYSQYLDEGGPVATHFSFDNAAYIPPPNQDDEVGEITQIGYDDLFEMEVKKFGEKATFLKTVKVKNSRKPLTGSILFMMCDDSRCLPPKTVTFKIDVNKNTFSIN